MNEAPPHTEKSARPSGSATVFRIEPQHGWQLIDWRELWAYRQLAYFLTWRDIKVRYKQTVLGALWAILQPTLTMIVFTIFFHKLANLGTQGEPAPLFYYAGLLPWTFFATAVAAGANSLVASANMLKKVYFPRLLTPISAVAASGLDFLLSMSVLAVLFVWYGRAPPGAVLWLPLLCVLTAGAALGIGLWLAALNIQFRDVRYVVPFLIQVWLFVTPVILPAERILAGLESAGLPGWLLALNPMAGVVAAFRWALLGTPLQAGLLFGSTISIVLVLFTGLFYFRRVERHFADVV